MRHINDAKQKMKSGDSAEALAIIDNLLGLASRNPDALRLKSDILESWGQFDESLATLKKLSQISNLSDECIQTLEACAHEEKEAFVYSELTLDGRWYYAFPKAQIWIALFGFIGCGSVLLMSPHWLSQGVEGARQLILAFGIFVLIPCLALLVVHTIGIKKILVGTTGLHICKRFTKKYFEWNEFKNAVIEYDNDMAKHHLRLKLYRNDNSQVPVVDLDISRNNSVVKARRHFVRNILTHVDVISYICRHPIRLQPSNKSATENNQNTNVI